MFSDRRDEIHSLEEIFQESRRRNQLLVIYGRRRVGKTTLVKEFLKNKKGLYIFIEPKSQELIFRDCESSLEKILGYRPRIDRWNTLFRISVDQKLVLVMDEFQNLGTVKTSIYAEIQGIWDDISNEPGLLFIVIGSYVGMIKKLFRDGKQPLFGRATGMMRLDPFTIFDTVEYLSKRGFKFDDCIKYHSILGGVPRYLVELEREKDNIQRLFFRETSVLREEGINILSLEFGSRHKGYFSVLESLSKGKGTPKEIADHAGMNIATVSKYLGELHVEYEIVFPEHPSTNHNRKLVRYRIKDNFLDFWFKYIYSNFSLMEMDPDHVLSLVQKRMAQIISCKMEYVVKDMISRMGKPIKPTEISRWWNRKGEEIDLVAVDERSSDMLLVEIKWTNRKVSRELIFDLKRKSELIKWRRSDRRERFLFISRSGFTDGFKRTAKEMGVEYWDRDDVMKYLDAQITIIQ